MTNSSELSAYFTANEYAIQSWWHDLSFDEQDSVRDAYSHHRKYNDDGMELYQFVTQEYYNSTGGVYQPTSDVS